MRKEPNNVNNIYLFASIRNSGLYESFFEISNLLVSNIKTLNNTFQHYISHRYLTHNN